MAEARKTKKDETADSDASIVSGDLLEEVAPPDEALTKLLGELDASQARSNVRVEKRERENGVKKWVFLFECAPAEFNITDIQQEYGAGDYRVRVYGPSVDGTNHYGIIAAPVISIGEPRGKARTPVQTAPQITAQDVAQIVVQTLGQMQPKAPSRMEMLEEMRVMRDVLGGSVAPAPVAPAPQKSFMEQAQEMLAFVKLLKGDAVPVDDEGQVDSGALLMSKAMETLSNLAGAARAQQQSPQAPQIALPPPSQTETANAEEDEMSLMIQGLLFAAKTNAPIESFAQTAYEKLPDEMFSALMNDATWWAALCALIPKAAAHQEWFTRLRARILELAREDDAPEDASAVPANLTAPHATGIQSPANTSGGAAHVGQAGASGAGGSK